MVIDVFTFNGEFDALDIRLNMLAPYVDFFVLVEAGKTFSGVQKPLYYKDNQEKYWALEDRIIQYVVDDYSDEAILEMGRKNSNVTFEHECWLNEFYQKESIKKALTWLKDDDIVFVSDVDEVWNPEVLKEIKGDDVYKPRQNLTYLYYLNQRTSEDWTYFTGTIATKYKNIKDACLNDLRTHRKNNYTFIENGGWHFNALGGKEKKINSFKHPVYSTEYMKTREKGLRVDESELPQYILENKDKYKHLFI
jgi:beta-1,4-mannosyl-glycoprotein beta-1,4-N-acetylglucosaminyltransferase